MNTQRLAPRAQADGHDLEPDRPIQPPPVCTTALSALSAHSQELAR
ncbi:unannotated protein [freshwater metagenome]|uniref:Unannotated protein n=1 Tax=freshwater metagenome TaxID=449393 RepID=A0A6J7F193_9ZZZZ|nr:hypothetical protein [Actinomycetota bacterium]